MTDPDQRVSGAGHKALREAGIAVTAGVLSAEAARAHAGHIARVTKGRPHVTLKLAVSADGMIGKRDGARMLISGKPAFEAVQAMRTETDAVMIGIGTALIDDPRLTVRLPGLHRMQPIRVVLDAEARLPVAGNLAATARETPVILFVGPDAPADRRAALEALGVRVIEVGPASGGIDIAAALKKLGEEGVTRVLAEGGAGIASSLVANDLADEVVLIRAPVVVGPDGVRALGGHALSAVERSPRFRQIEASIVGEDTLRRYMRTS
jgi:diaminohydroxyphosphoribosylaminopyrimidine deaminase/5-amino-6-(5-phosphoribosylamino)uracil reductase